jgi:hypothetical protein
MEKKKEKRKSDSIDSRELTQMLFESFIEISYAKGMETVARKVGCKIGFGISTKNYLKKPYIKN